MLNVLLVDDHELIRVGLKQVLYAGLGKMTVGEASNAADGIAIIIPNSTESA